ncbi:TetR/AcrR family transcriptional regulator [Sandaracinus amylolyticus]|uniref:TetR/AcrR family transcriptional regulator n=1 Tax=Sandaracinus amylolyticus TaxID=927083 RepID=UPI001F4133DF|nr:TetR/AcrR family transcriptional regulator [Sandaracinus amylolyticus]
MSTRELQRLQTRQRIYEHAIAIFRRDGVAPCRTDDIAKAAGVSRGAFYFHFPTKEHVLLERMRETESLICDAIDVLPADTPVVQVLGTLHEALGRIWEPDPQLLPDVVAVALRFTATTMSDQQATALRSTVAARFRAAAERGELSGRLPPETLGDLYLGHMLAGLLAWYASPVLPVRSVLDAVTDLFWNGARAPTSAAPPRATKTNAKKKKKKERRR